MTKLKCKYNDKTMIKIRKWQTEGTKKRKGKDNDEMHENDYEIQQKMPEHKKLKAS